MKTNRQARRLFDVLHRNIAMTNGTLDYDRVLDGLILLANKLHYVETDEDTWYIGEHGFFSLADLIVGSYWHLTEWHGGQDSKSYAAMCALGQVFSPGASGGPEEESGEHYAYRLLEDMAKEASHD
jgi:hypothetical protein